MLQIFIPLFENKVDRGTMKIESDCARAVGDAIRTTVLIGWFSVLFLQVLNYQFDYFLIYRICVSPWVQLLSFTRPDGSSPLLFSQLGRPSRSGSITDCAISKDPSLPAGVKYGIVLPFCPKSRTCGSRAPRIDTVRKRRLNTTTFTHTDFNQLQQGPLLASDPMS